MKIRKVAEVKRVAGEGERENRGETLCTRVEATDIRAILQTATAHLPGFIRRLKFYSL